MDTIFQNILDCEGLLRENLKLGSLDIDDIYVWIFTFGEYPVAERGLGDGCGCGDGKEWVASWTVRLVVVN